MCLCPLLRLEASSLPVPFVSISMLVLGGLGSSYLFVAVNICLFVCLSVKEAMLIWQCVPRILAMTAREILMQSLISFCNSVLFFIWFLFITHSPFYYFKSSIAVFENDCLILFPTLMGSVCHVTTIPMVPQDDFPTYLYLVSTSVVVVTAGTCNSRNNASVT